MNELYGKHITNIVDGQGTGNLAVQGIPASAVLAADAPGVLVASTGAPVDLEYVLPPSIEATPVAQSFSNWTWVVVALSAYLLLKG